MALFRLNSVSISFGDKPVLDAVNLSVLAQERVALVGRNGTGKSTLMKIIAGEVLPDSGEISRQQGLSVTRLEQDVPQDRDGTIYSVVAQGLGQDGEMLAEYQALATSAAAGSDATQLHRLENLQEKIDHNDAWKLGRQIDETLSRMGLDGQQVLSALSGGMIRRVLLARALVSAPDILLLDEPTNHLDVPAIEWLEDYLLDSRVTLIFITHDRAFLQKLATRIIELDRGAISDWPGDYQAYLRGKQAALAAEETRNALEDKKLAAEEAWIRQGIKARRTRNEGRVRALKQLRREHAERRKQTGQVRMQVQSDKQSSKILFEATDVNFSTLDISLISHFSATIMRGDKLGIIGPNGVGKSTLIKLLLGELQPDSGKIDRNPNLKIAYFDQLRSALKPGSTAMDNVSDGSDTLTINGKPRHIISYMQDFLFSPERARAPIDALSGGEKNRLMLARILARPSNLLILDEPTNDLDVETLELLEEMLANYTGTLLLVSHDRAFLDNVVTDCLVFEGAARVNQYVGGYSDWLLQRREEAAVEPVISTARTVRKNKPSQNQTQRKKLSYKEQRELDDLPEKIEALEVRQTELQAQLSSPEFYRESSDRVAETTRQLESLEAELSACLERWEELEERSAPST